MASSPEVHPTEDRDIEEVFDFPFLVDDDSVEFLNEHGRVFFVVRGLPGTGKSVLGALLQKQYPAAKIYWADKMFLGPLAPERNAQTLAASHEACLKKIECFMQENVPVIINRNTNVTAREVSVHTRLAAKYGYLVILANTGDKFVLDPKELTVTNSKGLKLEYLERRLKQWQKVYPIYTGWFLRPADGLFLWRRFHTIVELLSGWDVPKVIHPEGLQFCLGRPCWYGDATADRDYCESKEVKEAFGTVHTLVVFGYAVIHGLACALVALDEDQRALLGPPQPDAGLDGLLSGLSIREQVVCEVKLADIAANQDANVSSTSKTMDKIVSNLPVSFVVFGSCEKAGEVRFIYSRELKNLWQTTCAKLSITKDGVGCKDRRVVGGIEAFREGESFLILDGTARLRSVFGGYYQPYEVKVPFGPRSTPRTIYGNTRRYNCGFRSHFQR